MPNLLDVDDAKAPNRALDEAAQHVRDRQQLHLPVKAKNEPRYNHYKGPDGAAADKGTQDHHAEYGNEHDRQRPVGGCRLGNGFEGKVFEARVGNQSVAKRQAYRKYYYQNLHMRVNASVTTNLSFAAQTLFRWPLPTSKLIAPALTDIASTNNTNSGGFRT